MERYFIKVDNGDKPVAVYRLIDTQDVFAEELWLNGSWVPTDRLAKYLIDGEFDLNEITQEDAEVEMEKLSPASPSLKKCLWPEIGFSCEREKAPRVRAQGLW